MISKCNTNAIKLSNDISVYTCHVERSPLVMSSAVETSLKRFLHSLRSVGMTTGVNMYIIPSVYVADVIC